LIDSHGRGPRCGQAVRGRDVKVVARRDIPVVYLHRSGDDRLVKMEEEQQRHRRWKRGKDFEAEETRISEKYDYSLKVTAPSAPRP
jgi:hypothetical protein